MPRTSDCFLSMFTTHFTTSTPPKNHVNEADFSKTPLKTPAKMRNPGLAEVSDFFLLQLLPLLCLAKGLVFVGLLKDKEGLLLDALIGDQALAVEVVLQPRVDATGGAKVH
jgi:hypothetical protein